MRIASEAKIPVGGDIAVAFGCPFEGDIPIERLGGIVNRLLDLGAKDITLGDTTGMATPPIVRRTCEYLLKFNPRLPLGLHFHNTRGIGLVNIYEALTMGLTTFEIIRCGTRRMPFCTRGHGQCLHGGPRLPPP